MNVAASGGYYIALPADYILAHPTTITGSIGVLFLQPRITGLMGKIGVDVDVNKSGKNKDMGSPFRASTVEEKKIVQGLTDKLGQRFLDLVKEHRERFESNEDLLIGLQLTHSGRFSKPQDNNKFEPVISLMSPPLHHLPTAWIRRGTERLLSSTWAAALLTFPYWRLARESLKSSPPVEIRT